MSSEVIVNLPSDHFQPVNKKCQDIMGGDRSGVLEITSVDPIIRANQLEQNIKFLQEQHQIMLVGLHSEIEILRQMNRDLQFQIVFSKGFDLKKNRSSKSFPPESTSPDSQKIFTFSPDQVNPLQIEILERNLAELRTDFSEAKTKNVYLQNVIDEQKKKISSLENEKLDLIALGKNLGKENMSKTKRCEKEQSTEELKDKLEDADRLIRRLRRENEEQRKEIVSLRTSNKGKTENRRHESNMYRTYYRNGQMQATRFPPLQKFPHWRNSTDNCTGQNLDRGAKHLNKDTESPPHGAHSSHPFSTLPYLRDRNNPMSSTGYSNPAYNNYQSANFKRGFYTSRKQEDHRGNGRMLRRDQSHSHNNER